MRSDPATSFLADVSDLAASAEPAPNPPAIPPPIETWAPEDVASHFAERAAILQFDAGLSREEAEARAWEEIRSLEWIKDVHFWQRFHTALYLKRNVP